MENVAYNGSSNQTDNIKAKKYYLIIGPSGNGKSTFINYFIKDKTKHANVSDDYKSCTKKSQILEIDNDDIAFIDTRGLNDTEVTDNSTILKDLMSELLLTKTDVPISFHGIILVQDITSPKSYIDIVNKFVSSISKSYDASKSCVILATKRDNCVPKVREASKAKLKEIITHKKIKIFICWDSNEETATDQVQEFWDAISSLNSFKVDRLEDLNNKIESEAERLRQQDIVIKFETSSELVSHEITEQFFKNVEYQKLFSKRFRFQEDNSSNGINIFSRIFYHENFEHTESFAIVPEYPLDCQNKKITSLAVNQINTENTIKYRIESKGIDSSTGAVQATLWYKAAQFGYGSLSFNVDCCYSYTVPVMDTLKKTQLLPNKTVTETRTPKSNDSKPYMEEAKRNIILKELKSS